MKILIITTEIGTDGGGMSLSCSKIKDILSVNHEVTVSSSYLNPAFKFLKKSENFTTISIQKEYKLKRECMLYKDFEVVIAFGARYNGYYASLLAKRIHARFILCLRGSDINLTKWSPDDSWYLEQSCAHVSKIICLSKEMAFNLLSICPKVNGKILIIPNAIEKKPVRFFSKNETSTLVIGCAAAHLNEKKGISILLAMLACYKRKYDEAIELRLIGDIDDDLRKDYEYLIDYYHICENVVFRPCMSRNELAKEMRGWHLYVQASICEGHPNSIIEALNEGCGFISSKTGYLSDLLSEGYPELFFRSWEPSEMAEDLHQLVGASNKHIKFESVLKKLSDECDEEKIKSQWNNLLSYNQTVSQELNVEHVIAVALHDVRGELHDSITTPINVFDQFVKYIHDKGFSLCSMKDYLAKTYGERKSSIVCTFDDGYKSLVTTVAPILSRFNYTATVFICTGLIGADNKWNNKDATLREHLNYDDINSLIDNNWEIASHGVSHRNLLKLSDAEIDYELGESKRQIMRIAGGAISYAYPYGAFNKFIQRCVQKYYKYAFAVSQGGTSLTIDNMQIKRYSITEIYQMLK